MNISKDMLCEMRGCPSHQFVKGYCQKHYGRLWRTGDPRLTSRIVGENRSKNPVYKVYHAMLDRCKNPNNKYYAYYGGRGIRVCKRWQGLYGFTHFMQDMGERPDGLTLERINNEKGYSPTNCMWATHSQQQYNQRIAVTNTSGYKGVSLFKKTGKWQAYIYLKRKRVHLGYYETKELAAKARKRAEKSIK